jgi:hypothetical protein
MYDPAIYVKDDLNVQVITFDPVEEGEPEPYEFAVQFRNTRVAASKKLIRFRKADILSLLDRLTLLCKAHIGVAELRSSFDASFALVVRVVDLKKPIIVGARYDSGQGENEVGFAEGAAISYTVSSDILFYLLFCFKEVITLGEPQ